MKYIEAIGIKQKQPSTKIASKGDCVLIFEYRCPECDEKTFWIADPDDVELKPQDLLKSILDAFQSAGKSNKVSRSKISNKEFRKFKQDIDKIETHEDFLKYIGLDVFDIEKFKKADEEDGRKNK